MDEVAMAIAALAIKTNQMKNFQAEIDRLYDTLVQPSSFKPRLLQKESKALERLKPVLSSDSKIE